MNSFRSELLSAYALTLSRLGAWAVVSGLAFRTGGAAEFSEISVARGNVTLLYYLSLGLAPVLLGRLVAQARVDEASTAPLPENGNVLRYERRAGQEVGTVYASAYALMAAAVLAVGLLLCTLGQFTHGFTPAGTGSFIKVLALMCGGMGARVLGDVSGALLQSRSRLAVDNMLASMGEWGWPVMFMIWQLYLVPPRSGVGESAAAAFLISGVVILLIRVIAAKLVLDEIRAGSLRPAWPIARSLLWPAGILLLGHLADFCYAPMNQILLSYTGAGPKALAAYAPALQVDAALLLLTAAVGAVILPRATTALARGDINTVRRYYLRGTFACLAVLALGAIVTASLAGPLLHLWLGEAVPPEATAVLRLVLIHTVVGGTAGIGRAVLLAAGRYRAYATAALTAGLANVAGTLAILLLTHNSLRGLVLVTITTVTLRAALWTPWYTLRVLHDLSQNPKHPINPQKSTDSPSDLADGGVGAMITPPPP